MLRKLFIGAVCALSIVACTKTVDGILTNTEVLNFNVKNKSIAIPAGRWSTKIKFAGKKEIKLEVTTADQKTTEAVFKVLKGTPLPQENGSFELLSSDSGQPYDVQGSVKTTHVDSDEQWQTENCQYPVQRQECYYSPKGPVCHWVTYYIQGWRDVEFVIRDTTQIVEFNLLKTNKTGNAGQFYAIDQHAERIYKFQGQCR